MGGFRETWGGGAVDVWWLRAGTDILREDPDATQRLFSLYLG
jgi:hypothetical protein